jgi:hypothetical protein
MPGLIDVLHEDAYRVLVLPKDVSPIISIIDDRQSRRRLAEVAVTARTRANLCLRPNDLGVVRLLPPLPDTGGVTGVDAEPLPPPQADIPKVQERLVEKTRTSSLELHMYVYR